MHRIDWFTDNTDPRLVFFEPDTMHALGRPGAVRRSGRRAPVRHQRVVRAARRQEPLIAWHIKDADRIIPLPAPGTNPFTQERPARAFPCQRPDVVYAGEGSSGSGYPEDPDPQVLGFEGTFTRYRLGDPGWFHTESDIGPGNATTDPGRSLRWAKVSARNLLALERREVCL